MLSPGQALRDKLSERGWSQTELAAIIGMSVQVVNDIIRGKRKTTGDIAMLLGEALGTTGKYWTQLQIEYDVSSQTSETDSSREAKRMAEVYSRHPVREMVRRGWIKKTSNVQELEEQIQAFFKRGDFPFAARRVVETERESLQLAWLHRTYNIATGLEAAPYSESKLTTALEDLRSILMSPGEIVQIPKMLANAGVRFLIVEALPSSRIDGACFWLDNNNPVIALSILHNRIDNFWFTLIHELHHVKYRHGQDRAMLDVDIMERDENISWEERLADDGASNYLIPKHEIEGFIARVSPLFSSVRIKGFSNRIGVHPGIVVGQLQWRKAIEYDQHRKDLVKVKDLIIRTTPHDGWGMIA